MGDNYTIEEFESAYIRLKANVFHDKGNLLLRSQLAEFELSDKNDKLRKLQFHLSNYYIDNSKEYFNKLIDEISLNCYPKSINLPKTINYVSNNRIKDNYNVKRTITFINAPIEVHILCFLWIDRYGAKIDSSLENTCVANRLYLQDNSLAKGSRTFKPYFSQYKQWRDSAIHKAQELQEEGKDFIFINLDIKDYFNSIRMQKESLSYRDNIQEPLIDLVYNIHIAYTNKIIDISPALKKGNFKQNPEGQLLEFLLPIGLASSYILANSYLRELDKKISDEIAPKYYARYVDDIIIVNNCDNEKDARMPKELKSIIKKKGKKFYFRNYRSLQVQKDKLFKYYFRCDQSSFALEKLIQDLRERSSEFRDLPIEEEIEIGAYDNIYNLIYNEISDDSKILKSYTESRHGISVYLAKKIAARIQLTELNVNLKDDENIIDNKDVVKFLELMKGVNCISFYQFWEKIFTYILVNDLPQEYLSFYQNCKTGIDKINISPQNVSKNMKETLRDYLLTSSSLALSLNISFYNKLSKLIKDKSNE